MATLIPSMGACVARMTSGERRVAERLEAKLDADYLLWYEVPIGPNSAHPDFVVLHPSRGKHPQGRTTMLKINYRNIRQILHTASLVAADDKGDEGIPLLKPVSCRREGQEPLIIKLPTLQAEAEAIADHLAQAHKEGFAWGDMAVLCADTKTRDLCARTLAQRKLSVENRLGSGDFEPTNTRSK